jgi:hypothetical protein
MGFLDFLTKPRGMNVTERGKMMVSPYESGPNDSGGLLSSLVEPMQQGAPQEMTQMPDIKPGPSLLGGLKDRLMAEKDGVGFADRLFAVGEVLQDRDGMGYLSGKRDKYRVDQEAVAEKAEAKADLARRNQAFRNAYRDGKFDPQAYMAAIGDQADASEAFLLADKLAPKAGVSGDTPYTIDNQGNVTWGEERPWSRRDQEAADKADEMAAYRDILADIARGRLSVSQGQAALARQREGRIAAGGGRGGAGGPPPPGPGWNVQAVGP